MGLVNKRNIARAKALFDDNKDKIAEGVGKATELVDRKTGGKHRDKLDKIDEAANKMAGSGVAGRDSATDSGAPTDSTASPADTTAPIDSTPPPAG